MPTNFQSFNEAMTLTRERVVNTDCPCCGRSEWWDSETYGLPTHVLSGVLAEADPGSVLDGVPPEFADDGPDIFGLNPGFLTALAFACKWCGFLRFHRFAEG